MANLIKTLNNEIAKGNVFIDKDGTFKSVQNLEKVAVKEYADGFKKGEIAKDVAYVDFFNEFTKSFVSVFDILKAVTGIINPCEKSSTIAPEGTTENLA